ncbi:MAG: two-component regulator propeller domain-containing protein [Byssovorax sp.]
MGGARDAGVCRRVVVRAARALWGVMALLVMLVCGVGCGSGKAGGGEGEKKPRLEAWNVPVADAPGLLSGDVRAIAVDRGGALWFGTYGGGVSRYDPKTGAWATFTEKDGLVRNQVQAIAVDGAGALWFGTFGGGVSRYDPKTGAWVTFTEKDGLAFNDVHAIAVDGKGALWFGTFGGGVSRYDPKTATWASFTEKGGLANNNVQVIALDEKGALWFGTYGGGVSRYDSKTGVWATFTKKDGLASNDVQAIAVDREGALWFGTNGGGVSRYDSKTGVWATFTEDDGLGHNHVQAIAVDREGALWFGTLVGGVSRYDPKTATWATFTMKDGLAANSWQAIAVDEDGALWFGTLVRGVSRYDPKTATWATFAQKDGPAANDVQAITVDGRGTLWFGTFGGGVTRYDPKTGSWTTFTQKDGLAANDVQAIAVDGRGTLWFGTFGGGVTRYDPKTGSWTTFTEEDGLANNYVRAIAVDGGGALWFGTLGGGVTRYNPKTGAWKIFAQKDGLANNDVRVIAVDGGGALWFGTSEGGVSRYDPKTAAWVTFTPNDGLASNDVRAIAVDREGALWFGTNGSGVSRYDTKTAAWATFTTKEGLAANDVRAIAVDREGALWFGTNRSGVSRYDTKTAPLATFTQGYGLADKNVQAIAVDGGGALWFGMHGVQRMDLSSATEAGALSTSTVLFARRQILTSHETIVRTRPDGLSSTRVPDGPTIALSSYPVSATTEVALPGPDGSVWVGTTLNGLVLRNPGHDLQLTKETGLPSMTVTALAPKVVEEGAYSHPDPTSVWVGTTAGAALVHTDGQALHVERKLTWEKMPTGPVDALAAIGDGTVFVAYNQLPAKRFLDPELAARRSQTRVFRVPTNGPVSEIESTPAFKQSDVRVLAYSPKHGLWAATSAGLFRVNRKPGATDLDATGFLPETGNGRLTPAPLRNLVIAPDASDTLWMSTEKQGDTPPLVIGYRPGTDWSYNLTEADGVPKGDVIDDLTFTDQGELVVLVGSSLAKGRVFVPITPPARTPLWLWALVALAIASAGAGGATFVRRRSSLAFRIRTRPALLRELPFATLPSAIKALNRTGTLDEICTELDLPARSRPLIAPLASAAIPGPLQLRSLAELLGMETASTATVTPYPCGITLLTAHLPYPAPLRDQTIALVAIDPAESQRAGSAPTRDALEKALREAGHPPELPFLLLGGDHTRDLIPADFVALLINEPELKTLLFAKSPERTLAGLLHTRGLLAVSPYSTAGAVKEGPMFFGRAALLREILVASSTQQLIVGPRRIGKTSFLKTLERDLSARRTDVEIVFLDLLGIHDPQKAARNLARQLDTALPPDADPDTALADLLRTHFRASSAKKKTGVILIDEADGLVETDAAKGFPLLNAMRSLQAEGTCSFVLAGYLYLYREALNQRSPLFNFADRRLLGALEPEAARDLALVPMTRLGVDYADPALPTRIAERTGGYPSFIQLVCDAVLKELKGGDLTITAANVEQAEKSPRVRGELGDMFRLNAGKITQIAVYGLLDRESFTRADAEQALARTLGRAPLALVEQALLELRVFGLAVEQDGRFTWAIPLLRDTLLAAEPELAARRLAEELADAEPG